MVLAGREEELKTRPIMVEACSDCACVGKRRGVGNRCHNCYQKWRRLNNVNGCADRARAKIVRKPYKQRFTDAEILAAYKQHGSVHKAGQALGCNGSSLHERLVKLGANTPRKRWTSADNAILREQYAEYADSGKLDELAANWKTDKASLCAWARRLGLTNQKREKTHAGKWKYMTEADASKLWAKFKKQTKGLVAYCKAQKMDDLGFSRTMKKYFADEWDNVVRLFSPDGIHSGRCVSDSARGDEVFWITARSDGTNRGVRG
jgi:hypothetical protein